MESSTPTPSEISHMPDLKRTAQALLQKYLQAKAELTALPDYRQDVQALINGMQRLLAEGTFPEGLAGKVRTILLLPGLPRLRAVALMMNGASGRTRYKWAPSPPRRGKLL